ncbi:MAG: carboxypeptidase regulatory-like domain-containing protein [Flavobacteriia bacterium]|nr:carboxypeptidase regulatory-like domain-containing protein [Flavobacteriia bacterium]
MKTFMTILGLFITSQIFSQGQALGEVIGTIVDPADKTGIPGNFVWIDDDGKKYEAITDIDGKFRISAVPAGEYFVYISNNTDTIKSNSVYVPMDGFGNLGIIIFQTSTTELGTVVIGGDKDYKELILQLNATPTYNLSAADIKKLPIKFDMAAMIAIMSSEVKKTEDGELIFRGSRKGEMIYYLDGVKLNGIQSTPSCSINNMTVYTGGIPAKYGDTLGGVVVVETKSYFDLLREYRIQQSKIED